MTDAVYEPAYEPYEGERTSRASRVLVIARRGMREASRSTWIWVLFAITLVHIVVRGVALYVTGQTEVGLPDQEQIQFTARFLTDTIALQARWVVTFALLVIATDAISEDLQAGGLTFYFTKPLTKPGYLAGKLAAPFATSFLLTAVPMLVVWFLGIAFTPEALYPPDVWMLPLALLGASFVISLTASLVVLALSGLIGSSGRAAVAWIAIAFLMAGAARIAELVAEDPAAGLVDLFASFDKITQTLVSVDASILPATGAWLTVGGWVLASLVALGWSMQREEVTG